MKFTQSAGKLAALAFALTVSLSGCVAESGAFAKGSGKTLMISSYVWDNYQLYLQKVGTNRPGAFAVSLDGQSWGATTCRDIKCRGNRTYSEDALANCRIESPQCVIFAKRDEIVVDYAVID